MNFKTFLFALLFSLSFLQLLMSQDLKEEVENSINRDEMPVAAVKVLDEFWDEQTDIDYYRETDGETVTFEAKLDWQGVQYSIEFSREGKLLDVEQLIDFHEIPESVREEITDTMEEEFSRYRTTRIQQQFITTEDDEDDEDYLDDVLEQDMEDLLIRYEIEVEGQNRRELGSFEMLFDSSGELIQRRKIARRSIDNIW